MTPRRSAVTPARGGSPSPAKADRGELTDLTHEFALLAPLPTDIFLVKSKMQSSRSAPETEGYRRWAV
jgi:hypothetical protein